MRRPARPPGLRAWPILACCLLATAGAAADASGPVGIALGVRGSAVAALLASDANGLVAGAKPMPWDEVAAAGFPGGVSGSIDSGLLTVGGDVLRGVPESIDRGILLASSDLFGPQKLPVDQVAAVVLSPIALPDLAAACTGDVGALLANGDRVAGKVVFLNAETAGVDTGRRIAQVPRARITALILGAQRANDGPKQRAWLLLGAGDRVAVDRIQPGQGGIAIATAFGSSVLPIRALASVWSTGGRLVPLAQVKPNRITARDRLGTALPVRFGAGFPLQAGGVAAADGLVLPARGEAVWPLAGMNTLLCWVAPAPGAAACAARILVDGKTVWEHAITVGAAPEPVVVKVAGGRELTLCSDPGPDGETAVHAAAFCQPVLLK